MKNLAHKGLWNSSVLYEYYLISWWAQTVCKETDINEWFQKQYEHVFHLLAVKQLRTYMGNSLISPNGLPCHKVANKATMQPAQVIYWSVGAPFTYMDSL